MKTKLSIMLTLILLVIFMLPTIIFAQSEVKVKVNGEAASFDTPPLVENGLVLAPINGIFQKMGAEAKWDKDKNKVFIEDKYTTVELSITDNTAYVHKKYDFTGIPLKVQLDIAPKAIENNVFVPLGFVVESLGAKFDWDKENNTALIDINKEAVFDDTNVPYRVLTAEDIKINTELLKWYEDNYKERGIRYKRVGESVYVLVCAGEKSTGGYSIEIKNVVLWNPDEAYVRAFLESPGEDEYTIQVITYPNSLIKIDNANIKHVGGTVRNKSFIKNQADKAVDSEIAKILLAN